MNNKTPIYLTLLKEELKSIKIFLCLFYFIVVIYDLFYYYLLPQFVYHDSEKVGLVDGSLGIIYYIILLALLPIAVFLISKGKVKFVKYLYFVSFTALNLVNEILVYYSSPENNDMGNIAEVFFILFSPIFVNKRFFFLVSAGTIIKYLLGVIITNNLELFLAIIISIVCILAAFIILNSFRGYVNAIKNSYDAQLEGIVKGVVATLELKDPYTRGHSDRVAKYSLLLAEQLNQFSEEELKYFYYSCLLHDVGKINIPDHILMKPGKLTNEEYEIIKTHPTVGAEILQGIEGIEACIDVIKSHHERWDGKGYPEGLEKENIPLLARITAIADAFDAMTSTRSYRAALSFEEAYNRIIEGKATQFDPNLVDVFENVYIEWQKYSVEVSSNFIVDFNTKTDKTIGL
jgi:putative nucleotidyltransferase with HDIG domain